jgi:hypothetical protein
MHTHGLSADYMLMLAMRAVEYTFLSEEGKNALRERYAQFHTASRVL